MFTYRATVRSVHDGDTFRADVDLGFGVWRNDEAFRLYGLNAAEMGTPAGRTARDYVRGLMPVGSRITVVSIRDQREKYGRYLADVTLEDGRSVCELLLAAGHAVPWDGQGARPVPNG